MWWKRALQFSGIFLKKERGFFVYSYGAWMQHLTRRNQQDTASVRSICLQEPPLMLIWAQLPESDQSAGPKWRSKASRWTCSTNEDAFRDANTTFVLAAGNNEHGRACAMWWGDSHFKDGENITTSILAPLVHNSKKIKWNNCLSVSQVFGECFIYYISKKCRFPSFTF